MFRTLNFLFINANVTTKMEVDGSNDLNENGSSKYHGVYSLFDMKNG